MSVRTNLLLPEDLVAEVDRVAGPRGRSRYVTGAIEARLRADRLRAAIESTAGTWRDHASFSSSDAVVAWVRDRRADETRIDE